MGKVFTRGLDKDDQKEGLFKRLKIVEKAQKNLINGSDIDNNYDDNDDDDDDDDDDTSIYEIPRSQFDTEDDEDKDKENNKTTLV